MRRSGVWIGADAGAGAAATGDGGGGEDAGGTVFTWGLWAHATIARVASIAPRGSG